MRTSDLWNLGDLYVPHFKGVYPLDKLPSSLKQPANFIVNTHTHNLPGEHWLAVNYSKDGVVHAFDSFGYYYPRILQKYLHRLRRKCAVHYSSDQLQEYYEKTCGDYCIAWLIYINTLNEELESNHA
jgi:hypothetical protein